MKRGVAILSDPVWLRVEMHAVARPGDPEFRCQLELFPRGAGRFQDGPDKLLVVSAAITLRGIEQRHARFDARENGLGGRFIIDRAVALRETHAAQADCRGFKAGFSKSSAFHACLFLFR